MLDGGEAEMGLSLAFEPSPDPSTPTRPRYLAHARRKIQPSPPPLAGAFAHTVASLARSASSFMAHAAAASSPCKAWEQRLCERHSCDI